MVNAGCGINRFCTGIAGEALISKHHIFLEDSEIGTLKKRSSRLFWII